MGKKTIIYSEDDPRPPFTHVYYHQPKKRYGFFKFIADCILTLLTHGLWLIWVFVREMRGRRR